MKENKLQIREAVYTFEGYDIEGSIDDLIKTLEGYKSKFGNDLRINFYTDDDGSEFTVYRNRLETNEEYDLRMDSQERMMERLREAELEQLKKLREKYGQ